jgi:diguanylate cyclase (GGDEF)-like protein
VNNPSGQNDDDIVDLAKLICETSAAHVSLIDSSQQRTKPCIDADPASRVVHYCEQTMARPNELFVVPDVRHDVRFADCPMEFDGTQVCFYAGVALVNADGDTLGTLYVIDQVPHELTENQQDALWALSRQVVTRVELRNAVDELESNTARLRDYQSQLEEYQQRLERTNARLRTLSVTDDLTSLNNRFAFDEELRNDIECARRCDSPLSLLFLDADHFKLYNDEFGHPAGDDALRIIAEYLKESTRTSDFIARIGGDEFVIILPGTTDQIASVLAERCRRTLESCTCPKRPITLSIGISSLDGRNIDSDTLISEADQALYYAKTTGRNQVSSTNDLTDRKSVV